MSIPAEATNEEHSVQTESDRTEEVPALLGTSGISGNEESESVANQEPAVDAVAETEAVLYQTAAANVSLNSSPPDCTLIPAIHIEEHRTDRIDSQKLLETVQESLATTLALSAKVEAISGDTDNLLKQINSLSLNYELLSAEMESFSSGTDAKKLLSKKFLGISSVALALLVIFQVYIFISLIRTQRQANASGTAVLEQVNSLNNKMAAYDKNLTKALGKPAQQEHAPPTPAPAEKAAHEPHQTPDAATARTTPVLEKLNKLRNGLPEKKLIRKETGDWFVYNKKTDECIADVEVIESLNQAYKKLGRSLSPGVPLPAHNALCVLKPDGKGGTEIVMTKTFLP